MPSRVVAHGPGQPWRILGGLWQINLNAHKDVYGDLHNPLNNAKAAYEISGHGRNFNPWTTTHPSHKGTAADYRTYLPEVEAGGRPSR